MRGYFLRQQRKTSGVLIYHTSLYPWDTVLIKLEAQHFSLKLEDPPVSSCPQCWITGVSSNTSFTWVLGVWNQVLMLCVASVLSHRAISSALRFAFKLSFFKKNNKLSVATWFIIYLYYLFYGWAPRPLVPVLLPICLNSAIYITHWDMLIMCSSHSLPCFLVPAMWLLCFSASESVCSYSF